MNEERPDNTAGRPEDETRRFAAPTPPSESSTGGTPAGPEPQAPASGPSGPTWAGMPAGQQAGQQHPGGAPQPGPGQQGPPQHPGQASQGPPQAPHGQSVAYGQQPSHGQQAPHAGYGPGAPVATAPKRRRGFRAGVPIAALLAAVLASAGTYALTNGEDGDPVAAGDTTVVKGDPADYADAGTVNWSATANKVTPSVVAITARGAGGSGGRGSGVILDTKGNIVTNNHVVAGSKSLEVTLSDNRTYTAKVVGKDPSTDLAVIRLEDAPDGLKPATLGNDDKLTVGQPVMAVGNPLGLAGTVTTGIVSALNRPVSTEQKGDGEGEQPPGQAPQGGEEVVTNAIQTSAAINPGNSGGALVSGSGKLIGINSSIASLSGSSGGSQGGNIGIGFAIPVTVVKNITNQLIANGKAKHAQLGVTATNGTAKTGGASVSGAKVVSVVSGSGADKAGIKKNDVILKIDGESVDSSTSLVGQVRERTAGQRAALTVVRDGKRQNVTVTLGTAPSS